MNFETTNALTSRDRFRGKTTKNIAILGLGFAVAVIVWSFLVATWGLGFLVNLMGDGVALGVVYYYYTLWERRPIRILCPHCNKIILSNTPWICGVCGGQNSDVDEYPFVNSCKHCNAEPKSYTCHHLKEDNQPCGKLIFLSEDPQSFNPARAIVAEPETLARDAKMTENERLKAKEERLHRLEIAKIDAEINKYEGLAQKPKVKSPHEQAQEACERDYQSVMGVREYAQKKEREIEESLKGHPALLSAAKKAIKDIVRRNSP